MSARLIACITARRTACLCHGLSSPRLIVICSSRKAAFGPLSTLRPLWLRSDRATSTESVAPSIAPARSAATRACSSPRIFSCIEFMYGNPFFQKVGVPHVLDPVVRLVAEHPVRARADRVPSDVDLVVEALGDDRRVALPGEEADDAGIGLLQVQDEHVLRDDLDSVDRRHLGDGGDAARQRRVEHLLDRVLDVGRRDFLAVVELDAPLQRPANRRLADDLELLGECGPDVQLAVPLDERVVRELLGPVVCGQDPAERRHVRGVRLEAPDDPAAPLDRRRARALRRGLRRPPASALAATAPAPTAPALFSSSRRSSSPPAGLSDVCSSDIVPAPPPVPEVVRGSDRPLVPLPECRHKRRTHGSESWKVVARLPDRARRRALENGEPRRGRPSSRVGSTSTSSSCSG